VIGPEGVLAAGFLIDLAVGDPRPIPHPVVAMGKLIGGLETLLRRPGADRITERLTGGILTAVVVGGVYGLTLGIEQALFRATGVMWLPAFVLLSWLTASTLATRGLVRAGGRVLSALRENDLSGARGRLGEIVGRDTGSLDEDAILRATVETVAENTSDGITAPLFYYALGGLPLAMAYKAVNTLDSMVGYKNDRYRYFGTASARLDDLANLIPARLTALFTALAAFAVPGASPGRALRIALRDGRKHASPNAGYPEAATAGALGVRLGGPSVYGGVVVEKPWIGEEYRPLDYETAARAITLALFTAWCAFGASMGGLFLRWTVSLSAAVGLGGMA